MRCLLRLSALLALLVTLAQPCAGLLKTFGSPTTTSWPSAEICLQDGKGRLSPEVVILNHTLSADDPLGVMNQFFVVTQSDLVLAEMGARIEVRYAFDGEAEPSALTARHRRACDRCTGSARC